jgi:hypothetical protein
MPWSVRVPHTTKANFAKTVDMALRATAAPVTSADAMHDATIACDGLKALVASWQDIDETWLLGALVQGHSNPGGIAPPGSPFPEDYIQIRVWRGGKVDALKPAPEATVVASVATRTPQAPVARPSPLLPKKE